MASRNNSLIRLKIEGADDLETALRSLGSDRKVKAAINKALMTAAEPCARDARARAPHKSGNMAEGIDVSTTLSRRQRSGGGGHVSARGWFDPFESFVYIGAHPIGPAVLEEFGTGPRRWKNGKSTGAAPAKPFMRPAWEAHKMQILKDFIDYLWVIIQQDAARLAKKQAKLIAQGRTGK